MYLMDINGSLKFRNDSNVPTKLISYFKLIFFSYILAFLSDSIICVVTRILPFKANFS